MVLLHVLVVVVLFNASHLLAEYCDTLTIQKKFATNRPIPEDSLSLGNTTLDEADHQARMRLEMKYSIWRVVYVGTVIAMVAAMLLTTAEIAVLL